MKLPFLKQRADLPSREYGRCVSGLLRDLGIMPPVTVSFHVYYQIMQYDRTPPTPGDFSDEAAILGVEHVGHALRARALATWLTRDRAELAALAQQSRR